MTPGALAVRAIAAYNWLRFLRVRIEGREHFPAQGGVLVAGRHYHHLFDGAVLVLGLPRQPHLFVALDWVRSPFERRLMEAACALAGWPVALRTENLAAAAAYRPQDGVRYVRRSLELGADILRRGDVLAMFPEGYPTIDPMRPAAAGDAPPRPFRGGVLAVAARAERDGAPPVPILPAGLSYAPRARGFDVALRLGAPLYLGEARSRAALLDELCARVGRLSAP